jgi:hypothetical protein
MSSFPRLERNQIVSGAMATKGETDRFVTLPAGSPEAVGDDSLVEGVRATNGDEMVSMSVTVRAQEDVRERFVGVSISELKPEPLASHVPCHHFLSPFDLRAVSRPLDSPTPFKGVPVET